MELNVAPHAGAWIETDFTPPRSDGRRGVAPHAGAWIETKSAPDSGPEVGWSHPTRVRGLKPVKLAISAEDTFVAPHAGAWVETPCSAATAVAAACVAPHAGAWIETTGRTSRW